MHNARTLWQRRPNPEEEFMRLLRSLIALLTLAAITTTAMAEDAPSPQELCDAAEPAALTPMQFEEAEQVLEPGADYRAIFCTSAGAVYVDLYETLTPITVNNFVFLAQQGYYDNTSFHRVIPDFMAQGGDPTGSGRGGPGYRFKDEPIGFLKFDLPGMLAMANAGPGTNGSQFFITTAPTPHLNHKHTIFGDVLVGQGAVEAIRERDPSTAKEEGETLQTVLIISDPAEVDSSDVAELEPATQEQVIDIFESFAQGLPPALPLDDERSGHFSTEALAAASVAEDLQEDFATFAAEHGHLYRQRMQFANGDCDASVYFSSLGFWVDAFADAEQSAAAAQSDFMQQWLDSFGYERDAANPVVYRLEATTCGGEAGAYLLTLIARGRFLLTIDVLVAESILERAPADAILSNLTLQTEAALAAIFAGEIRP
jgi:cyclophilin family peptidyl-prolyl cis-trans isomerase